MTLDELIDRLEKATGPDRWLDRELGDLVGDGPFDVDPAFPAELEYRRFGPRYAPYYTANLDAIVSLVDRTFPRWTRAAGSCDGEAWAELVAPGLQLKDGIGTTAPTESLALCLAFAQAIRAVRQKGAAE